MAQRTLDVPEAQGCVNFDEDVNFRWHHRLLVVQLSPGVWVAATPDGTEKTFIVKVVHPLDLTQKANFLMRKAHKKRGCCMQE